MRDISYNINQL